MRGIRRISRLATVAAMVGGVLVVGSSVSHAWTPNAGTISATEGGLVYVSASAHESSGDTVVTGSAIGGIVDFDPSSGTTSIDGTSGLGTHYFVAKYDSSGALKWVSDIGAAGITDVAIDSVTGHIWVAGLLTAANVDVDPGPGTVLLSPNGGSWDAFLVELSSAGAYLNSAVYGGIESEWFTSIEVKGSSIYVAGVTGSAWSTQANWPNSGPTDSTTLTIPDGGLIAKINLSTLNLTWIKTIASASSSANVQNTELKLDSSENVFVSGYTNTAADLDAGVGTTTFTPTGAYDAYWVKYDSSGAFVWGGGMTTSGTSKQSGAPDGITIDSSGKVYIVSPARGTVTAGSQSVTMTSATSGSVLLTLSSSGTPTALIETVGRTPRAIDSDGTSLYTTGTWLTSGTPFGVPYVEKLNSSGVRSCCI